MTAWRAREFGFACVRNDRPDLGQSRSVALGTAAMADCDGIAFVVADQPLLSQELLRRIAAEWRAHPDCIVGAAHATALLRSGTTVKLDGIRGAIFSVSAPSAEK